MNHAQQRKDIGYLLNRKFGQLTVIGESPTRPRKGLWVTVRCDCGVERIARARSLEHGKQKTCGGEGRAVGDPDAVVSLVP